MKGVKEKKKEKLYGSASLVFFDRLDVGGMLGLNHNDNCSRSDHEGSPGMQNLLQNPHLNSILILDKDRLINYNTFSDNLNEHSYYCLNI